MLGSRTRRPSYYWKKENEMSFIQPEIVFTKWLQDGLSGEVCLAEYNTKEEFAKSIDCHVDDIAETTFWGGRLSAPGYLDCTEWTLGYTAKEVVEDMRDTFCECDGEEKKCELCRSLDLILDEAQRV